ncbi:MAG TPA: chloride channel protein [Nitrososphaerales archaeon]|nr:chloride channel protein [Nitrososphaerales archaeon]
MVVGAMARFGSERIRGHGIPEALEAILISKSRIDPKVTLLKPVSTAISIGSGGPFGAEGPIIMTGGSFGSVLGQTLRLSTWERKTLLVAGAAAGMAATFNTPLAAVLLAVELLLFEWRPRSLIPVGIASLVATVVRWSILGNVPLFPVPATLPPDWTTMLSAVAVGLFAGLASTLLTYAVYTAEDSFKRLPIHWMWWPAIGGFVVGVGGLLVPRALGVGYDTISLVLAGNIAIWSAAGLLLAKAVIWSVSLGSGTSGGVLAPLIMMGGALGTLEASFLPSGTASLFAIVSMGAVIGGVMRSPFTGVVFTLELTRNVNALPLLLVGALVADFVTVFTMKRSILTEKVARRGVHLSREYQVDVLEQIRVSQVMRTKFETIPKDTLIDNLIANVPSGEGGCPVVDDRGRMVGYLTLAEVKRLAKSSMASGLTVGELAPPPRVVAYPEEPTRVAADRLAETDSDSLPVLESAGGRVVGVFTRDDIFRARVIWFKEENVRERHLSVASWLSGLGRQRGGSEGT